jgi:hypothetical protein
LKFYGRTKKEWLIEENYKYSDSPAKFRVIFVSKCTPWSRWDYYRLIFLQSKKHIKAQTQKCFIFKMYNLLITSWRNGTTVFLSATHMYMCKAYKTRLKSSQTNVNNKQNMLTDYLLLCISFKIFSLSCNTQIPVF